MDVVIETLNYQNHTSILISCEGDGKNGRIEIHGDSRKQIAIAAINRHRAVMGIWNGSPSWKLTLDDAYGKRLLHLLNVMQNCRKPIRRDEAFADLVNDFSIEKLEKFLSVKVLLE
jgi:hypothetical protein